MTFFMQAVVESGAFHSATLGSALLYLVKKLPGFPNDLDQLVRSFYFSRIDDICREN